MDKLNTEGLSSFQHADTVFCALGTTRKVLASLQCVSCELHIAGLSLTILNPVFSLTLLCACYSVDCAQLAYTHFAMVQVLAESKI